jgi:hypothetical protein
VGEDVGREDAGEGGGGLEVKVGILSVEQR